MTSIRPMRLAQSALFMVTLIAISATNVQAQSRDRALESVRNLTVQLIEKTESAATPDSQIWAGVQALTDAMRRFALAETETRADEKVASPPAASLRPGQSEASERTGEPGPVQALSNVPRDWFNARITDAQIALEGTRSAVEKGVPRAEIAAHLHDVQSALSLVDRPPAQ